ncbi:MAG: hypothetical protein K2N63_16115 [Lachnospiraceae bacterium]|nr:hypothetical protein [Lachnospiraceae bacterium]
MREISKDHSIFKSDKFLKDQYMFSLILQNLSSQDLELYSDEESYIFCRGKKQCPVWIWTKDGIDRRKIGELKEGILRYLIEGQRVKYTCKKEIYDLLAECGSDKFSLHDYFEMGFLICRETKKPRDCDGWFDSARKEEREVLAKYRFQALMEMEGVQPVPLEQAQADVDLLLEEGSFFVLRNPEGEIVCMANWRITGEQARVTGVYTPPQNRRKAYAANLIWHITNRLLSDGRVPLLYTDYHYAPSNQAYKNAGYEDMGKLINFYCQWREDVNPLCP